MSWAFPGGPTASFVFRCNKCCQIRLPLCLSYCQPPFWAPRSFVPFSGGTSPGNMTPGRSRQCPSNRALDWTTGRTFLPSCAASPCGRSSELMWTPLDVDQRSTRSPQGCNHRTPPSEIRGCCNLSTFPNVFVVAYLTFATGLHVGDPQHSAWLCGNMTCCEWCPPVQAAVMMLSGSRLYLTLSRISPWWL